MTKHCVLCNIAFCANQDFHVVCPDCWEQGLVDGSEQQMKILRALDTLKGALGTDWTMIAESSAGAHIAEQILKAMGKAELRNLLRKVMREL